VLTEDWLKDVALRNSSLFITLCYTAVEARNYYNNDLILYKAASVALRFIKESLKKTLLSPCNRFTELGEILISFTENDIFLFILTLSSRSSYCKGLIKLERSFDGFKKRYDEKTKDSGRLIRWLLRFNKLSDDVKLYTGLIRLLSNFRIKFRRMWRINKRVKSSVEG
jgi:hypothetical protein